jgi:hypothetical protein
MISLRWAPTASKSRTAPNNIEGSCPATAGSAVTEAVTWMAALTS